MRLFRVSSKAEAGRNTRIGNVPVGISAMRGKRTFDTGKIIKDFPSAAYRKLRPCGLAGRPSKA
jgi:hypothetical protein